MENHEPPNFETSLTDLQQIVAQLEGGTLGLDASLAEFEKGVKLLRACYRMLESAEQKIELLAGTNEQGEPITEPFDASATFDAKEQTVGRRRRPSKKPAVSPPAESLPGDLSEEGALF
jgi:exodeoxyribonuclease VII small subunit